MEFKRIDARNNQKEFTKTMQDMLAVYDNNCIYVCHPNNIFNEKMNIDGDNIEVDWDNLNVSKMFEKDEHKPFITFQENIAYQHVYSRLVSDFKKQMEKKGKENAIAYLVIVEKYRFEGKDNFLVRGVIKADMKGIAVLFNPEFETTLNHNVFEIGLRLADDERTIPNVYKKTRSQRG